MSSRGRSCVALRVEHFDARKTDLVAFLAVKSALDWLAVAAQLGRIDAVVGGLSVVPEANGCGAHAQQVAPYYLKQQIHVQKIDKSYTCIGSIRFFGCVATSVAALADHERAAFVQALQVLVNVVGKKRFEVVHVSEKRMRDCY
eukprot:3022830-Pleurochrysis_carterae.AAC.1